MAIGRVIEKVAYSFLGNNVVVGSHIRRQIEFLRQNTPANFKYRAMDDLGCGDGKVTLLLKGVFLPTELKGFDIHPLLVKRARSKGIKAEVKDLDKEVPQGELAVVWGVLHHLRDKENFLERLNQNYQFIFIREPVRTDFLNFLELGRPLIREEIECLLRGCLPSSKLIYFENNALIFLDGSTDALPHCGHQPQEGDNKYSAPFPN